MIKDIAKAICEFETPCTECEFNTKKYRCSYKAYAEQVYNAGYRKAADNPIQRKKHRFRTWWRNKFGR